MSTAAVPQISEVGLSNELIAQVLNVPLSRVQTYWPFMDSCLRDLCKDAYTNAVRVAALATIRVECPPFMPVHEYGTDAQHEKLYARRMGNDQPGDGAKYAGRGFIQLTGEMNYKSYGDLLGVDLVHGPDLEMDPNIASMTFAAYFWEKKCHEAANEQKWTRVRELVNGGHNSLQPFLFYVQQLGRAIERQDIIASASEALAAAQQEHPHG